MKIKNNIIEVIKGVKPRGFIQPPKRQIQKQGWPLWLVILLMHKIMRWIPSLDLVVIFRNLRMAGLPIPSMSPLLILRAMPLPVFIQMRIDVGCNYQNIILNSKWSKILRKLAFIKKQAIFSFKEINYNTFVIVKINSYIYVKISKSTEMEPLHIDIRYPHN